MTSQDNEGYKTQHLTFWDVEGDEACSSHTLTLLLRTKETAHCYTSTCQQATSLVSSYPLVRVWFPESSERAKPHQTSLRCSPAATSMR